MDDTEREQEVPRIEIVVDHLEREILGLDLEESLEYLLYEIPLVRCP
jgi:hypothetical protein